MDKEYIIEILKESIIEILSDITEEEIILSDSLRDLGANSVDRMDIIVQCMKELKVKIPMTEFGNIKNMNELVELFYEKTQSNK